jgi:sortase A
MEIRKLVQYALAVAGILAVGFWAANLIETTLYEHKEAQRFDQDTKSVQRVAQVSLAAGAPVVFPRNGAVIGKLEISRINVSAIVVEGADSRDLAHAVGHISGTALPGEHGNLGIAGHRDTFFRPLRDIRRGDNIVLHTLRGDYSYRVASTSVVRPDEIHVLDSTGRDTMTLVTCFPFYYVGPAPERFIVRAERLTPESLRPHP